MNKMTLFIIGGALIVGALGALQFISSRQSEEIPIVPTTALEQNATTTDELPSTTATTDVQKRPIDDPLPLAAGDTIVSWDFTGAYTGNPELIAKARVEIKRLSDLLATATSSATILSISIANQYGLLGDGKQEYEYLIHAVEIGGTTSGLPWHNLGVLMERLGAYKTARIAYEKSTFIQPEWEAYQYAYIEFLTSRTKDDTAHIESAFAFAEKNIGRTAYLAELRTEWQKQ